MKHLFFTIAVTAAVLSVAPSAGAVPLRVDPAVRAEITALAERAFVAVRDGVRDPAGVFPTLAEMRAIFGVTAGGATPQASFAEAQFRALARDARDFQERFRTGRFVGLAATFAGGGSIDLHRCGRLTRADSQCVEGPVIEYEVNGERRRFRLDALVRVGGRWRVFDLR